MGSNHTAGTRLPLHGAISLAIKSVKTLSPHFFFWREPEPIRYWAISGISCSEKAKKGNHTLSIHRSDIYKALCSVGFQEEKTSCFGVVFISTLKRHTTNRFQL